MPFASISGKTDGIIIEAAMFAKIVKLTKLGALPPSFVVTTTAETAVGHIMITITDSAKILLKGAIAKYAPIAPKIITASNKK